MFIINTPYAGLHIFADVNSRYMLEIQHHVISS